MSRFIEETPRDVISTARCYVSCTAALLAGPQAS
jgi:hypothetical protein